MEDPSIFSVDGFRDHTDPIKSRLELVDHFHWVFAETYHHCTANRFGPLLVENSAPQGGAERNLGNVANIDGDVVGFLDDSVQEIFSRFEVADATNHVLDLVHLDGPGTHIDIGSTNRFHHLGQGNSVSPHRVGVHIHLVFLDITPNRGDLADTVGALESVSDHPILDGPKFLKPPLLAFEGVPKNLAQAGGVGA